MSPTFRALANPNYRRYLLGSVVSNTGTWMQRVAQDWLVLELSGQSGTAIGITTGLQFLPVLLLSPYAGVIADRMPKRRLLQLTQLAMAATSLLLGVIAVAGVAQTWHVYVLAFVFGIGSAFDAPARQSFVSEMVGPDDLTNAVGLNSATFNVARIAGPGLAGLMIGALGGGARATGWVILINALSYAAVIYQLRRMDPALLHTAELRPRTPGMLIEGVRYVRSQPKMVMILIMVFFAGTFGMNFQITSALMATKVFGMGAGEFGILGSAMAVGSLVGALLAARRTRIRLRLLVLAALGFGVANIVAGLLPSYLAFAAFVPLIGLCTLTLLNSANATMQLESDPALRGRVMALYMTIVMGGTPIGSPIIGWIGEHVGPRWTLISGGALTIVGVLLAVAVLAHLQGGLRTVLTRVRRPSNLIPRVWDDQTVARARK
ncbi:MFS transporter [Nocardioides panaciterrulae]|uniref:MFS family permease n=1 Tax=Nocardioides panaciterrulae TaxID=661492 RepID=A0A7Y9E3V6_9ACTN|nr:MFS transporter [Nocardioides panaciterrulae]NYD40684.1 MFS family permease [Nocardioides panaciterrulae]